MKLKHAEVGQQLLEMDLPPWMRRIAISMMKKGMKDNFNGKVYAVHLQNMFGFDLDIIPGIDDGCYEDNNDKR
jgi:hypothetical protein